MNTVLTSHQGRVGIIQLNRPKALNALNHQLISELGQALVQFDQDPDIGAILIKGHEKAFAAGADILEMKDKTLASCYHERFIYAWEKLSQCTKPTIAAVSGYALGGGCEIAMMCDMILAADNAQFGQPEVTIGTIPGAGGTQRLVRAVGKSQAMDMCLTGKRIHAEEALQYGLVSRVISSDHFEEEALKIATQIANHPLTATMMIKESINAAFEMPLSAGMNYERKLFYATFATEDQKEGMQAFAEKRKPTYKHQ